LVVAQTNLPQNQEICLEMHKAQHLNLIAYLERSNLLNIKDYSVDNPNLKPLKEVAVFLVNKQTLQMVVEVFLDNRINHQLQEVYLVLNQLQEEGVSLDKLHNQINKCLENLQLVAEGCLEELHNQERKVDLFLDSQIIYLAILTPISSQKAKIKPTKMTMQKAQMECTKMRMKLQLSFSTLMLSPTNLRLLRSLI
jgi:enamine deaminase RidA (YjgF/YER057c/UK114 family)